MRKSRGFTLIEVMIAASLMALVLGTTMSLMLTVRYQTERSALEKDVMAQAQRVVNMIANEVRSANYDPAPVRDMIPAVPLATSTLRYRCAVGFDTTSQCIVLSPSTTSGNFRRISTTSTKFGTSVLLTVPGTVDTTIARQIDDLKFDLLGGGRLRVTATVSRTDSRRAVVRAVASVTVNLANKTEKAR